MYYKLGAVLLVIFAFGVLDISAKDYFPYKPGVCPRPRIKGELDVEKFFSGKWYVLKSTGVYLFLLGGTCSTTVANVTADGTQIKMLHYQYEPLLKTYSKVYGTAQTKFTKFMGIYSPVEYDALGLGFTQFEVPFVVVDTDYDNWAIIYMCKQHMAGYKSELGWMLTRKRGDTTHVDTLMKSQKLIGNGGFVDEDNTNCGADEPTL